MSSLCLGAAASVVVEVHMRVSKYRVVSVGSDCLMVVAGHRS